MSNSYSLTIGNWSVDSADDPLTELVKIETNMALGSPSAACRISVYGALSGALGAGGSPAPGLSTQLRGEEIKPGDPISIELTAGETSETVVTAVVGAVDASLGATRIRGRNALQELAAARLNQRYENASLKQIAEDLAAQVGVASGEIESGSTYTYLLVDESRSVLDHLLDLARRDGMDVYPDPENALTVKTFAKSRPEHTFRYGFEILEIELFGHPPLADRVVVYGESPSSSQGADSWSWLLRDASAVRGEVGQGVSALVVSDPALRTKDAVDTAAAFLLGSMTENSLRGRLRVLGSPQLRVGDALAIEGALRPELNGTFKARSVRHLFGKREGFVTVVGFSGMGGAPAQGAAAVGGRLGL